MNKHVTNDPLAVIYNEGHWRLSTVSPLISLKSSTVKFKQYASKIRQAIVSTIPANSALKFSVVFEAQPYLKYSEDDSDGLAITVSSSQESSKPKVIYTSIFLSWGVSTKIPGAVHLPFVLERGEQRIGTAVKTTIKYMFDCNFKEFSFTQRQLLQFGFNFVENDTSRSTDPFTLCYRTQADHKNKLNLTFEVGDVLIIWNGIKEDLTKVSEQVTLAYQVLQNQIFYNVMLDVTALDLIEVILPKAEVKSNGTFKMKTPEIVNCVFTLLNEIISTNTMDTHDAMIEL
ncbi:unnamed protein product [Parnassius mnemosyne]|uniref:Centromere protein L n=1 Tax=Parnassius mnemosyne TaxID=213953 RepID=A0AAV1KNG2_9NEOP